MKIFKNPNRDQAKQVSPEPYTPEYIRLNKEPIVNKVSRDEFRRPPSPRFIAPPPQIKVNSGQNMDNGWMPEVPKEVVKTKSFTNTYYDEPLASAAISDFSNKSVENIKYDDVQLPQNASKYAEENLDSVEDGLSFSNLNVGEFVLMYDDDIIASGSEDDITNLLETILTSEDYNVVESKLVILKKMNFRTGVLISD